MNMLLLSALPMTPHPTIQWINSVDYDKQLSNWYEPVAVILTPSNETSQGDEWPTASETAKSPFSPARNTMPFLPLNNHPDELFYPENVPTTMPCRCGIKIYIRSQQFV